MWTAARLFSNDQRPRELVSGYAPIGRCGSFLLNSSRCATPRRAARTARLACGSAQATVRWLAWSKRNKTNATVAPKREQHGEDKQRRQHLSHEINLNRDERGQRLSTTTFCVFLSRNPLQGIHSWVPLIFLRLALVCLFLPQVIRLQLRCHSVSNDAPENMRDDVIHGTEAQTVLDSGNRTQSCERSCGLPLPEMAEDIGL